jgi:hypothetical protein
LAIDPSDAPAAGMIGFCRIHQRAHRLGIVSDAEIAEAVRLARGAIEAGTEDPDALWMVGWTLSALAGEHATAANIIARALTLREFSPCLGVSGVVSFYQNRPERPVSGANLADARAIAEVHHRCMAEPGEERAHGPVIGHAGVMVLDRGGEK